MQDPLKVLPITNLYLINENYGPVPEEARSAEEIPAEKFEPRKAFMNQLRNHIAGSLDVEAGDLPDSIKVEVNDEGAKRSLRVIDYFTGEEIITLSGSILDEWNQKYFQPQGFLFSRWV